MRKYSHSMIICSLMAILSLALAGSQVSAAPLLAGVGTGFTYQGQLKDGSGNPITASCDLQFGLYDSVTGFIQIGTQEVDGVTVTNGYFTVYLDFGPGTFDGSARWLQIAVRCPSGSGGFTTLAPRQLLTPTPYSFYALNAEYQNIVVVAKNGNSSGPIYDTITDALNRIDGAANSTNTFLIYVGPGTYAETVTMKPYVDIEGAGELTTKITSTGSASVNTGTVIGADNAELRFLTVENTGGGAANAIAIYNFSASPRLTHITATASGGTYNTGVYSNDSSPAMANVTATASGGLESWGVYNYSSSSPTMMNVTATGAGGSESYGVYNSGSSPTMTNVTATGTGGSDSYGVYNGYGSSPTMTNVTITASGGTDNYGVYNEASSSPTMTNVTATASGAASNNYGVSNITSSPKMTNVTLTASGGTYNYGASNDGSSPTMTNVTATASNVSGGTYNFGVFNHNSSVTIQSSVISADGGTSYGIYNNSSGAAYTVQVNNSRITAPTFSITQDSNITTKVGNSQLAGGGGTGGYGGGGGAGTYKCVDSYNGNYDTLSPACL